MSVQEPNIWIIQPNKALITLEVHPDKIILSRSEDHCHLMVVFRYNDSNSWFN